MSSYSKTMMDAAQRWLAANPDPDDPFLRYPLLHDAKRKLADADETEVALERLKKKAKDAGVFLSGLAAAESAADDVRKTRRELRGLEETILSHINKAPTPHRGKYELPNQDTYEVDIGRWLVAWARHGYNVFDLSQDFVAAMLLTDSSELDLSLVRLPFSGLLMTIPSGFARGVEGGDYTKIHLCELPRSAVAMLDVGAKVAEVLADVAPESARQILRDLQRNNQLGGPLSAQATYASSLLSVVPAAPSDDGDTVLSIHATDGTRVLDMLVEQRSLSWEAIENLPDDVTDDADKVAQHTIRQIVFGALAFLTASRGEAMTPVESTRKKKKREPKATAEPKRWAIGSTIRIDPRLIRSARGGAREAAFHIKQRFVVRGHYRNQVHGPARALRTLKWIAPFWKGPEEGARLVHTYKLDEVAHGDE